MQQPTVPATPAVSVVLCTFDRAPVLGRALASVRAQTDPGWELVVVDDGSSDDTAALVLAAAREDKRIRYLFHANRGLFPSRNLGVRAARGEWVTFLDSDDRFEPEHLAVRREWLGREPADLLHGGYRVIGDPYVTDRHDRSRRIHLHDCVVGATFWTRRRTFLDLGGFPEIDYAADAVFFERASGAGWRIVRVDDPTYVYDRTSVDSMCTAAARAGVTGA